MPSTEFTESIIAGLEYWQARTQEMDDQVIAQIDGQRQNLFRVVRFGLALDNAWSLVASVALQTVPLVNRRLYRAEWIPVLEEALARCPDDDLSLRFDLLIQLGRMQRLELDRNAAMETLQEAEELAKQLGDNQKLARTYYNIGRVHLDARHYPEAQQYSRSAREILDGLDHFNQALYAWTLNSLGHIAQVNNDRDLADEYFSQSLAIWRDLGDKTGIIRALLDLATNYRWFGLPEKAVVHFKEAERLLASTANELDKTLLGINLGSTYFDMGEWALAEEAFRIAYSPYLRRSGDLKQQAILTLNLGNVLLKCERLVEAEAYIRQSIELWSELEDDLELANASGTLGEILAAQGQGEDAIPWFDQAMILLEKHPTHPRAIRMLKFFDGEKQKTQNQHK